MPGRLRFRSRWDDAGGSNPRKSRGPNRRKSGGTYLRKLGGSNGRKSCIEVSSKSREVGYGWRRVWFRYRRQSRLTVLHAQYGCFPALLKLSGDESIVRVASRIKGVSALSGRSGQDGFWHDAYCTAVDNSLPSDDRNSGVLDFLMPLD
jgi:hypothetical protein